MCRDEQAYEQGNEGHVASANVCCVCVREPEPVPVPVPVHVRVVVHARREMEKEVNALLEESATANVDRCALVLHHTRC